MNYAECLATNRFLVNDTRAPDGKMAGGWRLVREGGWVRAFGAWWQDELLLPYVGDRVWMDNTDYWNQECTAASERHKTKSLICTMNKPKDKRTCECSPATK